MTVPINSTKITPQTRTYIIARHLMTDYGINVYNNKICWKKLEDFCSNWPNDTTATYFANAVFLFASKIQRGEI